MTPNPCKRCGRVPTYGVGIGGDSYVFCQTCDINLDIPIEDWNAMNPERASDCPVESQEPEKTEVFTTEMSVPYAMQVTSITVLGRPFAVNPAVSLNAGDHVKVTFYSDGTHKVEPVMESCITCRFMDGGVCCRYPQYIIPKVETYFCGEWRAK